MSENELHSEALLVREVRKGNEKAFTQLYDSYKDRIHAYALKLLKSEAFAQELLQDVFMKVWQKRETLDPSLSFTSFLYTVARNKCFDFLEKASNDEKLKQAIFHESQRAYTAADLQIITSDFEKIKKQAYETLPPKRRAIFEMSREEGMSYEEIGMALGISTHTVKSQMNKALHTLKVFLREHDDISLTFGIMIYTAYLL